MAAITPGQLGTGNVPFYPYPGLLPPATVLLNEAALSKSMADQRVATALGLGPAAVIHASSTPAWMPAGRQWLWLVGGLVAGYVVSRMLR